jgi:hypothetical protein
MKDLSRFVKEEFVKNDLFKNVECITTLEDVHKVVARIIIGEHLNVSFKLSYLKDYFISRIKGMRTDVNVINCNCTLDRFHENNFGGLIIFDNIKKCGHLEIIEMVKQYNSVIIC